MRPSGNSSATGTSDSVCVCISFSYPPRTIIYLAITRKHERSARARFCGVYLVCRTHRDRDIFDCGKLHKYLWVTCTRSVVAGMRIFLFLCCVIFGRVVIYRNKQPAVEEIKCIYVATLKTINFNMHDNYVTTLMLRIE